MVQRIVILSAILAASLLCVAASQAAESAPSPPPWIICGPNTLYMLLRGHERRVAFDEILSILKVGPEGVSLLDLSDAAGRLGLHTEVRRCSYQDLFQCQTPFVAHYGKGTSRPSSLAKGHFIIVTSIDDYFIDVIDGTTAERHRYRRGTFEKYWSGFTLSPIDNNNDYLILAGMNLSLLVGAVIFIRWQTARSSRKARGVVIAGMFLMAAISATWVSPVCATGAENRDDLKIWRTQRNSGLNSLYLFLRYYDINVSYEKLASVVQPSKSDTSLADLQDAAKSFGLQTEILRWGPADLSNFAHPAVVHVEDPTQGRGRFLLAYHRGGLNYEIVDGATVELTEISTDQFRRAWSGYVLVPARGITSVWVGAGIMAIVLTAIPTAFILRSRLASHDGEIAANRPSLDAAP
jgi:predicted double-glycine peptidase